MPPFLLGCLTFLAPVFFGMALLVKLTHATLTRVRGAGPHAVWTAALIPGIASAAISTGLGLAPIAVDCLVSAVALALLGKRLAPPPSFEV